MKHLQRLFSVFLIFILLLGTAAYLVPTAETYSGSAYVMHNVSANAVYAAASYVIDDMKYSAEEDYSVSKGCTLGIVGQTAPAPYRPFAAGRCIKLICDASLGGKWVSVSREFDSIAVGRAQNVICSVNCAAGHEKVYARLVLYGQGDKFETDPVEISGGRWNDIICALPSAYDLSYIDRADVEFMTDGDALNETPYEYYIDFIALSDNSDMRSLFKFMSESFYVYGGSMLYAGECMVLDLSGNSPYIESSRFSYINTGEANSVRVNFANNTGCRSMKLYYSTPEEPVFNEKNSYAAQISISSSIQSCYFPINTDKILQIKLVFEGSISGDIKIYSITPASGCLSEGYYGSVGSCRITDDGTSLLMTGRINEDALLRYKTAQLCLYEIPLYMAGRAVLSELAPVQTQQLSGEEFEIKYMPQDSMNLTDCAYTPALRLNGAVIPLAPEQYAENPEVFSESSFSSASPASKKGIAAESDAGGLGISHASVDIYLDRLISLDASEYYRSYGGAAFYYDSAYVKSLDDILFGYRSAGVQITARILLSSSDSERLNELLLLRDPSMPGRLCAWNVYGRNGEEYIRSALRFIAERYSTADDSHGTIENYAIGSGISDPERDFYAGDMLLCDYVALYEKVFRLCYNTIRSVSAGASVCVSLGNGWDLSLPAESTSFYDNRVILENLNNCINSHGNIAWDLAYDPYPDNPYYTAFNDSTAGADPETENISMKNIEVLYGFISRSNFYYNGEYRSIILLEDRPCGVAQSELLSADFVYSYSRISSPNYDRIKAYIVDRDVNYGECFKYIDTGMCESKCAFAFDIIGVSGFDDIVAGYDRSYLEKRIVIEKGFSYVHPSGIVGNIPLFDYSASDLGGWSASTGADALKYEENYMGYERLLRFILSDDVEYAGALGIECRPKKPLDLSSTPYLQFYVQLVSMPENVDTAQVSLTLFSGHNYVRASSVARKGEWVNLVCYIGDFLYRHSIDKIELSVASVRGESIGEPTVFISELVGISDTYSGEELKEIFYGGKDESDAVVEEKDMRRVYALIIIIIVAATIWIISILTRIRALRSKE